MDSSLQVLHRLVLLLLRQKVVSLLLLLELEQQLW
nr:MAG TPA: hypothetical protein [Caudoviricetes sp.]